MAAVVSAAAYAYSTADIVPAVATHRESVLAMLSDLLATGGVIPPTPRNLGIYGNLLDSYTTHAAGSVPGVALVATIAGSPVGFTMAGELPDTFETSWGRTAMGWGTFVKSAYRKRGIARRLRAELDGALRNLGFDTVIGGYDPSNTAAGESIKSTGFVVFQHLGAKRLREVV